MNIKYHQLATFASLGLSLLAFNACSSKNSSQNQPVPIDDPVVTQDIFELKPYDLSEISLRQKDDLTLVDVNLGDRPEDFVNSVWIQLTGTPPEPSMRKEILSKWDQHPNWRRIDIAIEITKKFDFPIKFTYSDPWLDQPILEEQLEKNVKRDLGAVCMFFFNCPDGVNGKMSWSNNHAPGMKIPDDILKVDEHDSGYLTPKNKGFWSMELRDASYAGLDFLLLNTYGPDIEKNKLDPLLKSLRHLKEQEIPNLVKLGLFDDTWTWGKPYFGDHWKQLPDMEKPLECVNLIYESKWKPFFSSIPREHWYLFEGKPVIYFYNGGTIKNRHNAAEVFRGLKHRFKQDFGVEPYLCVDSAFDKPGVAGVADQFFKWFSLAEDIENATRVHNQKSLSHAMVRWDSTSRSNGQKERQRKSQDLLHKNGDLLKKFLDETHNKDLAVIATWNDLGEGTGINRCFDYYWDHRFQKPSVFMEMIRSSQEGQTLLSQEELHRINLKEAEKTPIIH